MQPTIESVRQSEALEDLRKGYLPRVPLRLVGFSLAGYLAYLAGTTAVKFFRPGPKPEMFRDYRHTT